MVMIYFQQVGEEGGKRDFPKTIGNPTLDKGWYSSSTDATNARNR
jgi:hypothetical protein